MAIDSYIFGGNTGLTYEQLKRRRAVALALASQRRGFPKTFGEGLTYLGEAIGDTLAERRLDAAERGSAAYGANLRREIEGGGGAGAPPPTTPLAIPPAAPRPPTAPVRPPAAPVSPRPAPTAAAQPRPPVLPSGPSSEAMTSGPPPSEFAMGGILNAAPMAAPNLEPVFPGEEGIPSQAAGILPSSGYLPPAATAAAPSIAPAPQAAPSAPAFPRPPEAVSPELQRAQEFQRSQGRPVTGPTGAPAAPAEPAPGPQSGLTDFIARQEGFRPSSYWDYKQHSIGYGTRGQPGETITREEGRRRLESEVANARQEVENFAPNAPPGVKDALTSLTYNAGSGWQQAGLGRLIREGRYDEARERFAQYNKAGGSTLPGLVSRRNAELSSFWDQAGGDEQEARTMLASLAPTGGAGAPIPGMGGAGAPRLRPQIPPLQGPPQSPDEQVTPTDIEPAPSTAQFGPPVGRFSRSDAPVVGLPPATAAPAPGMVAPVAPAPPAPAAPPAIPGSRPSQEPIPPATPQVMADPGPAPQPPPPRPMHPTQQKILNALTDPRLDPNGPDAVSLKDTFGRLEAERQRQEKIELSDYTSKREGWEKRVLDREKFVREEADRNMKQQAERIGLQKSQAETQKIERELAGKETKEIGGVIYERTPAAPGQPASPWSISPGSPGKEGKITETEGKTLLALRRSTVAQSVLTNTGALAKLEDVAKGKAPFGAGNYLVSPEYQTVKSAADAWLLHTIRHESGAAIGLNEVPQFYPIYFPVPGDSEQQIATKNVRRREATRALYDSLGGGAAKDIADKFFEERKGRRATQPEGTVQVNPKTGKTRRVIGGHWEYDSDGD